MAAQSRAPLLDSRTQATLERRGREALGLALGAAAVLSALMLLTYAPEDPNWMRGGDEAPRNWLGMFGASLAHPLVTVVGRAAWALPLALGAWGLRLALHRAEERARALLLPIFVAVLAVALATLAAPEGWEHAFGLGGMFGDTGLSLLLTVLPFGDGVLRLLTGAGAVAAGAWVLGVTRPELLTARRLLARLMVRAVKAALRGMDRAWALAREAVADGRRRVAEALEAREARLARDREALLAEEMAQRAVPAREAPRPEAPWMPSRAAIVRPVAAPAPAAPTRAMPPAWPLPAEAPDEPDDEPEGEPADVEHLLVAPPRAPLADHVPAERGAGFLSALLRRARGDAEAPAPESLSEPDRIRARIGDAIRARAPAPEARVEPRLSAPTPLAAVLAAGPVTLEAEDDAEDEDLPAIPALGPALSPIPGPEAAPLAVAPPLRPLPAPVDEAPPPVARPPRPVPPPRAPRAVAYEPPPLHLLADPATVRRHHLADDALSGNARLLEGVLDDYGVKGEIVAVRPGPVVTMYELEPAPGLKASRVIGLSDDIARSMSALSARVSTVPGRSVIGIELPNDDRERVVLREILAAPEFGDPGMRLPLALGKDIGGEPVIANLAKMPHLLIAGTTGSGKSVAINTMILSLLYKLTPEECRLIMIDPKMLELSVYDGIPHLLSPVVTDPKKAVVALKWVVGEMEERYRKMSKMGVRNIEGYNGRVREALAHGEMFSRTVQTGFDDETGEPVWETDEFAPEVIPFIVVVVDEMADLMMVAGKEIEACIQRLAQMARASGIHLIMATQRPSVDVITGTIKANFPTRISFQVTSKIDSRTILGEQGAEQLLGQGDMLYMAGGGRITRIHGPFCSDEEVEEIVTFLKGFGPPDYVGAVLEEVAEGGDGGDVEVTGTETEDALYDMAVQIVARDRKCSTSYIQRKLAIGYNKAARLVEQMETQGVVTPANHVGKREILVPEAH